MFIQCIVVGINHWDDLTRPFLEGLSENNSPDKFRIICVDNNSDQGEHYPSGNIPHVDIWRTEIRLGYAAALNYASVDVEWGQYWDWLLCCNNDCLCDGDVTEIISRLRDDTVYGNEWKNDYSGMKKGLPAVADSAYLLIPRKIWDVVGMFDPEMDAAFEEIDYQIRVLDAGYRVDVVDLPITHLNMHTRREAKGYDARWHATEKYFLEKHPGRREE